MPNDAKPTNVYKGTLTPFTPKRKRPPEWTDHFLLGDSIGYTTLFRCWVNGVSLEYPEPSVHIGLNNSKGSLYATTTSSELRDLANKMLGWANIIDETINRLEPQKQQAEASINQFQNIREMLKASGYNVDQIFQPPHQVPVPAETLDDGSQYDGSDDYY